MDLGEIVSLLAAIAAVVTALISARRQFRSAKPDKEISIEILSDTILPLTKELEDEIKTNLPLPKQMRLISVRVRNTGNMAILSSDYMEPIRLAFNELVLSSALIEDKATSSTPLESEIDQDVIVLPAMRLRPRSSITINTLLSGEHSRITVRGLIADGEIVMVTPSMQSIAGSWRWSEGPN